MNTERLTAEELAACPKCGAKVVTKNRYRIVFQCGSENHIARTGTGVFVHGVDCLKCQLHSTQTALAAKDVHIRTLEGRESALRAALEPFGNGTVARHIEEGDRTENSQKYAIMQDRIKDWLGCSDFRRARAALAGEPSGVHTPPGCVSVPVEVAGDALFLARLLREKHPTLKTNALTERTINALSEIVPTGMAYHEAVEAHRALDALAGDEWKGKPMSNRVPCRCPVCNGNGLVPPGFYGQTSGQWSTTLTTPESCRSCGGSGIVWEPPQEALAGKEADREPC